MSDHLVIFDDQFNALEFMDHIDIENISDHFSIDKYKVFINDSTLPLPCEPYTIIPYAVVITVDDDRYDKLASTYGGIIISNFSYD